MMNDDQSGGDDNRLDIDQQDQRRQGGKEGHVHVHLPRMARKRAGDGDGLTDDGDSGPVAGVLGIKPLTGPAESNECRRQTGRYHKAGVGQPSHQGDDREHARRNQHQTAACSCLAFAKFICHVGHTSTLHRLATSEPSRTPKAPESMRFRAKSGSLL